MVRNLPILAYIVTFTAGHSFLRAEVDFEKEIRPIFAEKCTLCHGPDDAKAGLRLTSIEEATRELKSGNHAIVPGQVTDSTLFDRIHTTDPDDIMPPPDKAEPLTEAEKKTLEQWIAEGADWPVHWAYEKLEQPTPPEVKQKQWVRNPIDAFVLARLEKENIAPSAEATPDTLIRRLSLDLIGLPPSPEEVTAFEEAWKKDSEKAYTTLVDRLLASERFGERWGRHWLDKARYADSDGYEKDRNRADAWRYRDWVIDAINADMPFDEFTIEQLAGDLLPDADTDQKLATAFNRQTLTNTEGGTDKEQWRVAAVMDRSETLGAVWLGLTVTCARCHTHKYDQLTQKEYYELYAYFDNGDETNTSVPRSEEEWAKWETDHAAYLERLQAKKKEQAAVIKDTLPRLPAWEKAALARLETAKAATQQTAALPIAKVEGPKEAVLKTQKDGTIAVTRTVPATGTYIVEGELTPGSYTGLRLDVISDPKLETEKGRNFVLNHLTLTIDGRPVTPAGARADFSQGGYPVENALDPNTKAGKDGTGWAISPQQKKDHWAEFGFAEEIALTKPAKYRIEMVQNYGGEHTIGRFRLSALTQPTDLIVPAAVKSALTKPAADRNDDDLHHIQDFFLTVAPETKKIADELAAIQRKEPKSPSMDVRVISQRTTDPRTTHILRRGEFKQPLDEVTPGTPASLPEVEHRGEIGDRLDLARWLVSGDNPLPPRVLTNHVWSYLFGDGIVTTTNDFGVRGDRPSHPELLDWLAAEWIRLGWSRKALIRTIVSSATYRQSSDHRPELVDLDPKNRLLHRQNRFRVEAETVRDAALEAAGLLSGKVGGPSVFPPIPDGVADVNYNSAFKWVVSKDEDRYRRGMYTFFKRTAPHPNLMTFDCPDSNVTCVQRVRSNTPLAALITLNNEVFHEAAIGFAQRILTSAKDQQDDDHQKMTQAFQVALSRTPDGSELEPLLTLLRESRTYYKENSTEATELLKDLPAAEGKADPIELAAWSTTLRVLLNLDEFLTRS